MASAGACTDAITRARCSLRILSSAASASATTRCCSPRTCSSKATRAGELLAAARELGLRLRELVLLALELFAGIGGTLRADLRERDVRAALQIRVQPGCTEHDCEVFRVGRNRRIVGAQPLEQLDALVELAVAMRLVEHEDHQLGRGIVIDDRHGDAVIANDVERARRIVRLQPRGELGIADRVDRGVHGDRHQIAVRCGDVHGRGLRASDRSAEGVLRRRACVSPGHAARHIIGSASSSTSTC